MTLRLPTWALSPSDVLRVGIVARAGFRYSPLFRSERPFNEQYPGDTLLSYRTQFQNAIKRDDFIALVQEDALPPEENDKTKAIIPHNNGWEAPEAGDKVIVGVISIKLEPGSARRGQLKNHQGSYADLPECLDRDLNRQHYDSWGSLLAFDRGEHYDGDSIMSMIVTHPAYWKLAQCVGSVPMSQALLFALGLRKDLSHRRRR
ncbi:hypothetical protein ACJZ2D_014690 [Fusarium nematophilum]